ncbi:MAG: fructosamine kinase family protein [Oscillatoriales cyanobacterium SM2_2_1]|nr:fructosamine kinase family protein [Oscillatoriales cyanobacterium SM2_2_1]
MIPWAEIGTAIAQTTKLSFVLRDVRSQGGGCINDTYRITDGNRTFFVKLNQPSKLAMFEAEAQSLEALGHTQVCRAPRPITWGVTETHSFLVLEWLNLTRSGDWAHFGQVLAALHRVTGERFGWHRDNTIGATPQINTWCDRWSFFWQENRLGYQLRLSQRRGFRCRVPESEVLAAVPRYFATGDPQPSLVHGDLWSGNVGFYLGAPVVFDPALYYGDREVDIAMSELFGGFPTEFYRAYQSAYPLSPGYQQRKVLYNAYHILNHFNLFGGSYAEQAQEMLQKIAIGP